MKPTDFDNLTKLILIICVNTCRPLSTRRDLRVNDMVDYYGSQVIRVVPNDHTQLEYLNYLYDIHHDNVSFQNMIDKNI